MSDLKKVLAKFNKVIASLENNGFEREANILHKEFVKISQLQTPASDPTRARRINGPQQMEAIKKLQKMLQVPEDGLFGPATADKLVMALDGLAPEEFLKPDYKARVQQYVAGLDYNFKTKLIKYVGQKDKFRALQKMPAAKPFEEEPSQFKLDLLKEFTGY